MIMKVTAIIAAAGIGKRFGSQKPKQFIELAGKPILFWSIKAIISCPLIEDVIIAGPPQNLSEVEKIAQPFKEKLPIKIVEGGALRQDSVELAVNACRDETKWLAIHDAARPLVTPIQIEQVCLMAREIGAAILALPIHDTVKEVDENGLILKTLERTRLFRAQTPQVCKKEDLLKAISYIKETGIEATDEASMLEAIGIAVGIVQGSRKNFKITTKEDLLLAEALINTNQEIQ